MDLDRFGGRPQRDRRVAGMEDRGMTLLPGSARLPRGPRAAARRRPTRDARAAKPRSLLRLTKPRIVELLLVTTVPAMLLAAHGRPSPRLVAMTLLGGSLTAGAANTLNCYFDRDIDALMPRTRRRPLPAAEVTPRQALAFGCALGAAGAAVLAVFANLLAAGLAVGAGAFYVLGYTLGLKRRTPSNIVWGGAAGCAPVLVGWAAVTGRVGWPAVVLFLVVFFWTPPHFWALASRFRADYAVAGVPMLPSVAPAATVARRIVTYTWLTVAASLLLVPVGPTGPGFAAAAVGLGGWFLVEAHRLAAQLEAGGRARPMTLFRTSIGYLTLLCAALSVDSVLRLPW
jgi:heme o synthase